MFSYYSNNDPFNFYKHKRLEELKNMIFDDLGKSGEIKTDLKLNAESFFPIQHKRIIQLKKK